MARLLLPTGYESLRPEDMMLANPMGYIPMGGDRMAGNMFIRSEPIMKRLMRKIAGQFSMFSDKSQGFRGLAAVGPSQEVTEDLIRKIPTGREGGSFLSRVERPNGQANQFVNQASQPYGESISDFLKLQRLLDFYTP